MKRTKLAESLQHVEPIALTWGWTHTTFIDGVQGCRSTSKVSTGLTTCRFLLQILLKYLVPSYTIRRLITWRRCQS